MMESRAPRRAIKGAKNENIIKWLLITKHLQQQAALSHETLENGYIYEHKNKKK